MRRCWTGTTAGIMEIYFPWRLRWTMNWKGYWERKHAVYVGIRGGRGVMQQAAGFQETHSDGEVALYWHYYFTLLSQWNECPSTLHEPLGTQSHSSTNICTSHVISASLRVETKQMWICCWCKDTSVKNENLSSYIYTGGGYTTEVEAPSLWVLWLSATFSCSSTRGAEPNTQSRRGFCRKASLWSAGSCNNQVL